MKAMNILGRLLKLVSSMKGWMALAIFLGVLGNLSTVLIPVGAAWGVSQILAGNSTHMGSLFALLIACGIVRGFLRYGEQACNHYIAFKLLAKIRDIVFGKLRTLAPAKLDGRRKGDLISLITSDVELLEVFYAHTISPIAIAILCGIVFTAAGCLLHWSIGLLMAVSYLVSGILVPLYIGKKSRQAGSDYRKQSAALSSLVLENVTGMKENLQFDTAQQKLDQIMKETKELAKDEEKLKAMQASTSSIMQWVIVLFGLLMTLLSVSLAASGTIPVGTVVIALLLQESTFGPFTALANLGTGLAQTLGAGERVLALLDEEPVTKDIALGDAAENGDFVLQAVNFAYPSAEQMVIQNFNYSIPKGTLLGISGPSGCGKSTLLKLLMRFYDPQSGTITLDDKVLNTLSTDSLRNLEAMMAQDTFLFEGTVEDNLRIAKADATREEMEEA